MSPRKPVPTLYKTAMMQVKIKLQNYLEHHLRVCTEHAMNVTDPCEELIQTRTVLMSSISSKVANDLMREFSTIQDVSQKVLTYNVLHMLINKDIREFTSAIGTLNDLWMFIKIDTILHMLKNYGANMCELILINGTDINLGLFCEALENMPKLQYLKFDRGDMYMDIIGKTCRHLCRLDISRAVTITEEGFKKLCFANYPHNTIRNDCCDTLQVVSVCNEHLATGSTGFKLIHVTPESVCILLENLPHLKSLGIYQNVGEAISLMVTRNKPFSKNFVYVKDINTTAEILYRISETCKYVEHICLNDISSKVFDALYLLANVKKLVIHRCGNTDLESYLEKHGHKLEELAVSNVLGKLNFQQINRLCPNLQKFCARAQLYSCEDLKPFVKLQTFHLLRWKTNDIHQLIKLVNCMPNLKKLWFSNCKELTDADMISAMTDPLCKLESILLCNCHYITEMSFSRFIRLCPRLKYIGDMYRIGAEFPAVSCVELRNLISDYNYDVTLCRAEEFKQYFL